MDEESVPSLPQYPPPNPSAIPVAERSFGKPLFKLMKQMVKPRQRTRTRTTKTKTWKKKHPFY